MAIMIEEKGIIFRIRKTYRPRMDALGLYEATRAEWRLGKRRIEAKYGFAVSDKKIVEVYAIDEWLPAGTSTYQTRNFSKFDRSRWEFSGRVADDWVRNKYIGKTVSTDLLRGSNPIIYTWH